MGHCSHLGIEEREDVMRLARQLGDEHWSPEQIEGRIGEERPDLAVSGTAICRACANSLPRWRGRSRSGSGSPSASARPATPERRAPTRTPTGSCATSSRRAGAWMARPTRRRTRPMPCSAADRASASAGSARRRPSAHRRCTCSEIPPLKSPAYPYCSHQEERDHTNGSQQDTENQFT